MAKKTKNKIKRKTVKKKLVSKPKPKAPPKKVSKKKVTPKKVVVKKKAGDPSEKKKELPKKEGWVALELSQRGESERDIAMLKDLVIKALGKPNLDIFIPIHYEDEEFFERNIVLLSGYFFIRHEAGLPYYKLKDSKFFDGVVVNPKTQEVQIVPEDQIKTLKGQFDQIAHEASQVKVGDSVRILDGLYKNLIGKITKIIKKDNMCIIKVTSLKSRNITVSASFLSVAVVEDDESDIVTFF